MEFFISFLLEQFSGIPTNVFYASEFRYSPPPLLPNILTIGVTQSGETADTIAAINMEIKRRSLVEDENFKPNLILLGHADSIFPQTLRALKKNYTNLKIAQWFLDP